MPATRRMLSALLPLGLLPVAVLPAAGCGAAVAASPGAAYESAATPPGSAPAPAASAPAASAPAATAKSAGQPARTTLIVEKTPAGYVLATAAGHAVYTYSEDKRGSGKSACVSGCLSAWPAVTGKPAAAGGVRLAGPLSTITWPDGTVQATYDGYPLYTYAADTAAGQAAGDGEGGVWHAVKVAGPGM
ncbi:MAG: hypothetical protein J2P26_07510 [Nocardiopsaceae bacterium]|nr:hypothetical protein [Nocardiopsaceae bacterium]